MPSDARHLSFSVLGRAAPQGSKRPVRTAAGLRTVESSKAVGPYRQAVAHAALQAAAALDEVTRRRLQTDPLHVAVTFMLARPKGHLRSGRHWPAVKPTAPSRPAVYPDLDKLERALLDGLSMSQVIRDDAQVCIITSHKRYAHPGDPEQTIIEVFPLARTVADAELEAA